MLRQTENFCGAESAAHRIIQKEVVQFVGPQKLFRFLRDLTVFCRKQLRTYRCVYNVAAAAAFGIGTAVLSAQKKAAFSGSAWCRTSACMSVFGTETFTAYIDKWSPP